MEPQQYNFIKYKVLKLTGVDLNAYKAPQVQRRLKTYLLRAGYSNWPNFFRAIQDDPIALTKFKDYLTINVSSFFRDSEKFEHLRKSILPELLENRLSLRVWSAGCSYGYEPYSVAILLAEVTNLYRPHFLLATDIDHTALDFTTAGGPYTQDKVAELPTEILNRYFNKRPDGYYVNRSLNRKVTVKYHNLLADPFEEHLDLIVCRNVVIYFSIEAKQILYKKFHDALCPGGILFVGSSEILPQYASKGFETAGISFYRRID